MDAFVRKVRDEQTIKLYLDWHSYSQLILFPFGHKETLYAPELGMWTKAAALMSETIAYESANATTYTFGPSGATIVRVPDVRNECETHADFVSTSSTLLPARLSITCILSVVPSFRSPLNSRTPVTMASYCPRRGSGLR
jgi:hypothetical protein